MNEQLIKLIELCLMDGVIYDKEREVIFKKSKKLGVDEDECEIILEGMIQEKEKLTKNSNSTNISVKSDNSDGFKPKKVPKSVLIDLNNSEKLLEEKDAVRDALIRTALKKAENSGNYSDKTIQRYFERAANDAFGVFIKIR